MLGVCQLEGSVSSQYSLSCDSSLLLVEPKTFYKIPLQAFELKALGLDILKLQPGLPKSEIKL